MYAHMVPLTTVTDVLGNAAQLCPDPVTCKVNVGRIGSFVVMVRFPV